MPSHTKGIDKSEWKLEPSVPLPFWVDAWRQLVGPQFARGLSGWPETAVTGKGSEKERNAFSWMRRTLGQVGAGQEGLCAITRDRDGQGARSPAAFRERKKTYSFFGPTVFSEPRKNIRIYHSVNPCHMSNVLVWLSLFYKFRKWIWLNFLKQQCKRAVELPFSDFKARTLCAVPCTLWTCLLPQPSFSVSLASHSKYLKEARVLLLHLLISHSPEQSRAW